MARRFGRRRISRGERRCAGKPRRPSSAARRHHAQRLQPRSHVAPRAASRGRSRLRRAAASLPSFPSSSGRSCRGRTSGAARRFPSWLTGMHCACVVSVAARGRPHSSNLLDGLELQSARHKRLESNRPSRVVPASGFRSSTAGGEATHERWLAVVVVSRCQRPPPRLRCARPANAARQSP